MKGDKVYRHSSNQLEKIFHDEFIKLSGVELERIALVQNEYGNCKGYISERETKIMINTIQWLGSPVGRSFMNTCLEKFNFDETKD